MPKRTSFEEQFVNFCYSQSVETVDTFLRMGKAIVKERSPKTEPRARKSRKSPAEQAGLDLTGIEPYVPVSAEPARNQV